MAEGPVPTPPSGPGGGSAGTPAGGASIDVQALAEKVYNLLLADARLSRARGSSVESPRRHGEG
jgi:hypothetical protein